MAMAEPRKGQLESEAELAPAVGYRRYHIDTAPTLDLADLPHRFLVEVDRVELLKLLVKETWEYWGHWDVVTARPCVYGVFSGPIGGFAPRPEHCVGCLRCTIQHPEAVTIRHNPEWKAWGDAYLSPKLVETILSESALGAVPVKGQGYRGRFGGPGWDRIWSDMSEIVRPTRDGIHGRVFISTVVDIGSRPMHLATDGDGERPRYLQVQLPILFDSPPESAQSIEMARLLAHAAEELETLAFLPLELVREAGAASSAVVPQLKVSELEALKPSPRMVEILDDAPAALSLTDAIICERLPFEPGWRETLLASIAAGVRVFHLVTDYHGRGDGRFVRDLVMEAHALLVEKGLRDMVTLIGSGGIAAAEHVPKAIICGFDAVALDTPVLAALQAQPEGSVTDAATARFRLPASLNVEWGVQRLKNLSAAWRDQLLEILGAMGLREVRRLRGELGRAMFQRDLEQEAFGGIDGYE